jgi:hypothetical protein
MRAPQKTAYPYLVYNILRVNPDNIKGSVAPVDVGTVLIDIFSTTYADCAVKAILVRTALDNQHGSFGGVTVNRVRYITEQDNWDEGLKIFSKTMEFEFRINN